MYVCAGEKRPQVYLVWTGLVWFGTIDRAAAKRLEGENRLRRVLQQSSTIKATPPAHLEPPSHRQIGPPDRGATPRFQRALQRHNTQINV